MCFKGVNAVFLLWRMHAKGIEVTKKITSLSCTRRVISPFFMRKNESEEKTCVTKIVKQSKQ